MPRNEKEQLGLERWLTGESTCQCEGLSSDPQDSHKGRDSGVCLYTVGGRDVSIPGGLQASELGLQWCKQQKEDPVSKDKGEATSRIRSHEGMCTLHTLHSCTEKVPLFRIWHCLILIKSQLLRSGEYGGQET